MAAGKTDHPLERLVFFSDAVFAIAITLLVIEIHPPHLPHGTSDHDHLHELANLIPAFVGYFISFAVVGNFWAGHHRAFSLAAHYDPRVLGWNLAFLAIIAFMPFATAYLSANFGERVPTVFYCGVMFIAALFNFRVNRIATSPPIVDEAASPEVILYVRIRGLSVLLGAFTAVIVAALLPAWGQIGLISIPFWRRLFLAAARRRAQNAEAARVRKR
jgi:uncharacterized membrane protein